MDSAAFGCFLALLIINGIAMRQFNKFASIVLSLLTYKTVRICTTQPYRLYIVQNFHVAGNHPSQIFPTGYEPGTALFHHDRDGSLTKYRVSVVRKPHSGGQRKSCERYGQPEVPGVLSRLRASVDWLGGRIQGNDTYSSTTGRIVEVQRGRQQAPGYVARGSGIRGRSHISWIKSSAEYSFHPPTSEQLSGGMVLTRLQVKDERELRL